LKLCAPLASISRRDLSTKNERTDLSLRLASAETVAKVAAGGELLWKQKLSDFCSAPLALECGLILVNACHKSYLLDAHGQTVRCCATIKNTDWRQLQIHESDEPGSDS
jgi:hypothetical protein